MKPDGWPGGREESIEVTVIVPVFNNAGTLEELHQRIVKTLEARGNAFEILFVDDGSRDNSWEIISNLRQADPRVRGLRFSRNFGQPAAICAGLEHMRGNASISIDADLQNYPEDIPVLLDEIAKGHDFASGYRLSREDSLIGRRIPSMILNRLVQSVTGIKLRDFGCGLNAATRQLSQDIIQHGEMRRFLKPLGATLAHSIAEVPVRNQERKGKKSSYGFMSLLAVQFDFVTSFSRKPFQFIGIAGGTFFVLGFVGAIIYLIFRFGIGLNPGVRLQALLALSMVLGLQLAVLGLLGEFIVRIFHLSQGQPFYIVREEEGSDDH